MRVVQFNSTAIIGYQASVANFALNVIVAS